jgi:DivIVA domain-containing protein
MSRAAPLTPQEIAGRQFAPAGRRGFDRDQVTAFLAEVARAHQAVLDELAATAAPPDFEQLGREAGALLATARQGAESIRREAEEEANQVRAAALEDARTLRARADNEAAALVEEAQATRARAEEEAAAVREEAAADAERTLREAEVAARRLHSATERQCDEMLAEAAERRGQLREHEREIRERIAEVEFAFAAFRERMEAVGAEEDAEEESEDLSVMRAGAGSESPIRLQVESVQPKPIFDR